MNTTIILNGPPGSGKDTIGMMILGQHEWGTQVLTFKHRLIAIGAAIAGVDEGAFGHWCSDRKLKELPMLQLNGRSPRQWLIYASEEVIKPHYGRDYFGKAAAEKIVHAGLSVFTDGGFLEEAVPVIRRTAALDGRTIICRVHRPGCDYQGDSRRYLTDDEIRAVGARPRNIFNDGGIDDLARAVSDLLAILEKTT